MTSVPKPLKFLRPHYPELQELYETWQVSDDKVITYHSFGAHLVKLTRLPYQSLFADILSVLAMTYSDTEPRGTLRYRLLASSMITTPSDPGLWGHEYIRHLAAELGEEFAIREKQREDVTELQELGVVCTKFFLAHHAEPDAIDLMEELEIIEKLTDLVDENTYGRVCAYMVRYVVRLFCC